MEYKNKLKGKVALVAGATRGAGRGIACMLGEAGATVYCTGRSVSGKPATRSRPETIEETAEMVTARGGQGLWHVARYGATPHTFSLQHRQGKTPGKAGTERLARIQRAAS